jgi:long-chain fatty acid transport protein
MDVTLDYPQVIVAGYSFRPTPDWNFEVDVEWTDWSVLNTPNIIKASGATPLRFDYESSFVWNFGVTRQLGRGFYASAGYTFAEETVPSASFNPVVPDVPHHTFGVGLGRRSDRFSWDITYQYSHGAERTIAVGGAADGTYRFESHAVQLGVALHF